jgi:hypothetical protein
MLGCPDMDRPDRLDRRRDGLRDVPPHLVARIVQKR